MQPRETLVRMLLREHELRVSEDTQKKYAAAEVSYDKDWMEVSC